MAKIKQMATVFLVVMVFFLFLGGLINHFDLGTPPFFQKIGMKVESSPQISFECEYLEVIDLQYTHVRSKGFYTLVQTHQGVFVFPEETIIKSGFWVYRVYDSYDGSLKKTLLAGPLDQCPQKEELIPPGPNKTTPFVVAGLAATICVGIWFMLGMFED